MYFSRRFYLCVCCIIVIVAMGYIYELLYDIGVVLLVFLLVLVIIDTIALYEKYGITAERHCPERFSNGESNDVSININSGYHVPVRISLCDEIPVIFERRDVSFMMTLDGVASKTIKYQLTPVRRGEYDFGHIRIFVRSVRLGLVVRQFVGGEPQKVKVYPSFLMLRKYELLAISNNLTEIGIKKIRRIGQQTDFSQIRDYVKDDEYRKINWKASARRNMLMVNVYEDERSQQVYHVIDKGRAMQQTFNEMTLLDYAINASLIMSYIAMLKGDKSGLITFSNNTDTFLEASRSEGQIREMQESLYSQQTTFDDTDYSALCIYIARHVHRRSLMIIYTNFSNFSSMSRQMEYLLQLGRRHRVLVVFFEDSDINDYVGRHPKDMEQYYQHVIAEKSIYEKKLIVSTLRQNGVLALLTTPKCLSIDVINQYLEMKSRGLVG